ncbi:hypothetical protein P4605_10255 [Priestia aryabhattai]|uniref:hypothetical protein n=1 Tax=Priestia aryabhattai TaxID=412384 RepID=UPI002E2072EF|nr:hypothetical protein [Priestia aryabhattai]
MKSNPKNFSVKIIKGHAYIYSWAYRSTAYRSHSSVARYYWKYRGRFGTRKVRDFMRRLNNTEQMQLKEEVQRKLQIHKEIQKQVEEMLQVDPYKARYNNILSTKNRITRENELKKFYSELNSLIKDRNEMKD